MRTLKKGNASGGNAGGGNRLESAVTKRLQSELMSLMNNKQEGVSAFPEGENFLTWVGCVVGPAGSAYDGLSYRLTLRFPNNHPFEAPVVRFETPCFHPNVDSNGAICLDILKEKWAPVHNVSSILLSIQGLLCDPNPDSPLNPAAAHLWTNPELYKKEVLAKYA